MQNSFTDHPGHLIDFMPTMLELADAKIDGSLPGQSLVPVLHGKKLQRPWPLYWQFGKSRAIRDQKLGKLVKQASAGLAIIQFKKRSHRISERCFRAPRKGGKDGEAMG